MSFVTLLMVLFVAAGIGIAWYLVRRYQRTVSRLEDGGANAGELQALIAAYRTGRADPRALTEAAPAAAAPARAAPSAPAASAPAAAAARSGKPGTLLRPEVKVAYLSLKAGLRDHHVFPNVPLTDLGQTESPARVDLLVCRPDFSVLAAIDVNLGDDAKAAPLRAAGIRYLRFSTASMPKPAELRALLYRT